MDLSISPDVPPGHTLLWIAARPGPQPDTIIGPLFVTTRAGWWERTFSVLKGAGPIVRRTDFMPALFGWRAFGSGRPYVDHTLYCRWWLWPVYRLGYWLWTQGRYVPLRGLVDLGVMTTPEGGVLRWRDIRPYRTAVGKARLAHYQTLCTISQPRPESTQVSKELVNQ